MKKIVYEQVHNNWKLFLEQQVEQKQQINIDSLANEFMNDAKTLGQQAKQRSFKVSKSKVKAHQDKKKQNINEEVLSTMGIASIIFAVPEVCVLITKLGKGLIKKVSSDPNQKTPILDKIEHFAHDYHEKLLLVIKKLLQALYFVFSGMSNDLWQSLGEQRQNKMAEIVHKAIIAFMITQAGAEAIHSATEGSHGMAGYEGFMTALKSGTLESAVTKALTAEFGISGAVAGATAATATKV